jgi:Lrp/AsnC family transcriptional regulator, leucine-responsive regulatory protein
MSDKIDRTGLQILRHLVADGRMSHTELGKAVGLSSSSVYNRVQHLEQSGVIDGYTTVLNPQKLGYGVTAFIFVQTSAGPEEYQQVAQFVAASPFITEAYDVTGDAMFLMKVQARSLEELGDLLKALRGLPVVTSTETVISLATLKHAPFVPESADGENNQDK